jgi:uncharacterized protein
VEPSDLLGNITTTHMAKLIAKSQQRAFGAAKLDTLPRQCLDCSVRFACNGECPKNRFISTPDGEPGLNYLCAGYLAFFTHIDHPMQVMADLLRRGGYADEAMAILAAEHRDDGRQDPTPAARRRRGPLPRASRVTLASAGRHDREGR